jgi:transcriptional regulator with XRE-family HTH domain
MPLRDTAADQGTRRGRFLRTRLATELETARLAAGLSYRELARQLGIGHELVAKALRADPSALTVDFVAKEAGVLGLELGASLHPVGDPVRDKAHLALIRRFRARLGSGLTWRSEVPIPIAGDRRSADGIIAGPGFEILVEAETRLDDVQAMERKLAGKRRDLGIRGAILLIADTRHNRDVVLRLEELRRLFPVGTRACLAALARGREPDGDALVIL